MNNKFIKISILLGFSFLIATFTAPEISLALLGDIGKSSLGACETQDGVTTHTENFRIELFDDDRNIEQLLITTDDWDKQAPNGIPFRAISHSDFTDFTKGVPLRLYLESYDPYTQDQYSFAISHKNGDTAYSITGTNMRDTYWLELEDYSNSNTDIKIEIDNEYSKDYYVDSEKKIRVLPGSYISLVNDKTLGKEIFNLDLKFTGTDTLIYMGRDDKEKPFINTDSCNLNWNTKKVFENIEIELNLEIPLKLKTPLFQIKKVEGKDVINNPKSINFEKEVINKANAKIKVNGSGIYFDPGFPKEKYANQISSTKNNQTSYKTPIGFSGNGFILAQKGDYIGLSTESDLTATILGLTNFALGFVAVIAVLILIYGGYLWIVDAGQDQLAEKSRKVIASAVIGILLIISAYTIINTIISFDDAYPNNCNIGVDLINGDPSLSADCNFQGTSAITGGVGSLVGGVLGGGEGATIGGILGGFLGL